MDTPEQKRALLFNLASTMQIEEVVRVGVALIIGPISMHPDPAEACESICQVLRNTLARVQGQAPGPEQISLRELAKRVLAPEPRLSLRDGVQGVLPGNRGEIGMAYWDDEGE